TGTSAAGRRDGTTCGSGMARLPLGTRQPRRDDVGLEGPEPLDLALLGAEQLVEPVLRLAGALDLARREGHADAVLAAVGSAPEGDADELQAGERALRLVEHDVDVGQVVVRLLAAALRRVIEGELHVILLVLRHAFA